MIWVLLKKKKTKRCRFGLGFQILPTINSFFCDHNPLTLSLVLTSRLSLKMGLFVYGILPLYRCFSFPVKVCLKFYMPMRLAWRESLFC